MNGLIKGGGFIIWIALLVGSIISNSIASCPSDMMGILGTAEQGQEIDAGFGDQPDIALDSKGNAHIVTMRNNTFTCMFRTSGTAPNRYTVIQWDTFFKIDDDPAKFQVVLFESGNILINILDNTGAVGERSITGVNQDANHGTDIGIGTPPSRSSYRFTWDGQSDYTVKEITYLWLDASVGEPVWIEHDESCSKIPIGFDFEFYGTSYQDAYVSSNGYISFTEQESVDYTNPFVFPSASQSASNVIAPLWDDWNPEPSNDRSIEVFYSMINGSTGDMMIAPTLISDWDGISSLHPAIAVDHNDHVHVAWHDERWDSKESTEMTYTYLNPYADDLDGDPAFEPGITLLNDIRISNVGEWATIPRMVCDQDNHIHIVWENSFNGVFYMELLNSGRTIVEPTRLKEIPDAIDISVDVAIDSKNNPHLVWNDQTSTMIQETYYMMLDGSGKSTKIETLIDATLITADDNHASMGQSISLDSNGMVNIVWMDDVSDSTREVWYTKLDPGRDDQNGDSGNEESMTVVPDQSVGGADQQVHRVGSYTAGEFTHITWWNQQDENLYYTVLDEGGNAVVEPMQITTTHMVSTTEAWTNPRIAVDKQGKAHMVWFDWRGRGIYYTTYLGPALGKSNKMNTQQVLNPSEIHLLSNYPNPFNPSTQIRYQLSTASRLNLTIFDVNGKRVKELVNAEQPAGNHHTLWDGQNDAGEWVAGGVYFCRLSVSGQAKVIRMVLLK